MLQDIIPQPAIDHAGFAELSQAIVQSATESQKDKKKILLSKARTTNRLTVRAECVVKVTDRQTLLYHIGLWRGCNFTLCNLSQLVEDINSKELFNQYRGAIGVRKLLSVDNPPIQPMIDANLVPRMIEFMKIDHEPQLQLEAAWVLTNIASGTTAQTQLVLDKGAIPMFAHLLRSNNPELKEQCMWALGNIAGDSARKRDLLLKHGIFQPLLDMIDAPNADDRIVKHGTWALSNLCRGRPQPKMSYVKTAIPTLFNVITMQTDPEVLTDAAWALSYLSDSDQTLDIVISCSNAIPSLVAHLSHAYLSILIPCLRSLGNVCCGTEVHTDAVLNHPGFLENLYALMQHPKKPVRRESLWVLSNLAAGTEGQIKKLFTSFPFVEKLIAIIQTDNDHIKKEAVLVLSNALKHGGPKERLALCNAAVLSSFISLLQNNRQASTLTVVLEGIHRMLQIADGVAKAMKKEENLVLIELEKAGALDKFDILQDCEDKGVYNLVIMIVKEFMPFIEIRQRPQSDNEEEDEEIDEDDEDEN